MKEFRSDGGVRDEKFFRSRTYPGQIQGVDHENGKITVALVGAHERHIVDIPLQGLSVNGFRSSWQRHMPQVRDYVEIAFDIRNRAYAVRVISWKFNEDSGGYQDVTDAAKANPTSLGLIWRTLAQGEFDLRSAGGAGYYFTRDGHATIQAGPTMVELDKVRNEGISQGGLWVWKGDNYEVRFGDVKRKLLPTDFAESAVVVNPAGAAVAREWRVKIGAGTPPAGVPALTFYEEHAGDIRDDTGVPVMGGFGSPLRYLKEMKDASGLVSTLKVDVDALGNVRVTQAALAAAGGIDVGMATNPFSLSALSVTVTATTNATLEGTVGVEVKGGATAHFASAGLAASHPMVYGDLLLTAFNTHVHATAFGPTIGPPVPVLLGPGVDMSLTSTVD